MRVVASAGSYTSFAESVTAHRTGRTQGIPAKDLSRAAPFHEARARGTLLAHENRTENCVRWTPGGISGDIEDRRGGGGFGRTPLGIGGFLILLVLSLLTGKNFLGLFSGSPSQGTAQRSGQPVRETPAEHREVQFVSFVLDDVQNTWDRLEPGYRHARLVLFRDATRSACGFAQSATGPFYCPEDEKVYIDLGFYDELRDRFGAGGDFAQAYVIAHEIGHHVQKILRIEQTTRRLQEQNPGTQNRLSVALELQADCLAGVWGHSTAQRDIIDQSDVAEALQAAAAIGDDRLQRMSQGYVAPESFTHGSSAQRVQWFRRGLDTGQVSGCDTGLPH
jgi:uncharacterized protein